MNLKARLSPRKIAQKVRKKCEKYVKGLENSIYGETLSCLCAVASKALQNELVEAGYNTKLVYGNAFGDTHCWVELDGKIYDITATQFGVEEKVYVTDVNDEDYEKEKEVKDLRFFSGWPIEQKPLKRTINQLLEL